VLTAGSVFREIYADDRAYQLFCSIAAAGEDQGGWENERISALARDRELAPKIARHGADERKHGRIFNRLLRKRGLEPVDVPPEADYCMRLERQGIGLSHERLKEERPLTDRDVITYLVHSRVTEQRASEDMRLLVKVCGDDPEIGKAVRMIAADEDNHLAYCHEELLRLSAAGQGGYIRELLRRTAKAEIRTHRGVGLAVMGRMSEILGWPSWRRRLLAAGVVGLWAYEEAYGWRRMVALRMPEPRLRNAMAPAQAVGEPTDGDGFALVVDVT
jgi:rubrerythrin